MKYGNQSGKRILSAVMLIALHGSIGAQVDLLRAHTTVAGMPATMADRTRLQAARFVSAIKRGIASRPKTSLITAGVATFTLLVGVITKYKGCWPFNQPAEDAQALWLRHPYAWLKTKSQALAARITDGARRAYRHVRPEVVVPAAAELQERLGAVRVRTTGAETRLAVKLREEHAGYDVLARAVELSLAARRAQDEAVDEDARRAAVRDEERHRGIGRLQGVRLYTLRREALEIDQALGAAGREEAALVRALADARAREIRAADID